MSRARIEYLCVRAFIVYMFKPSLQNWRNLRRLAMARLPAHTTTKPKVA